MTDFKNLAPGRKESMPSQRTKGGFHATLIMAIMGLSLWGTSAVVAAPQTGGTPCFPTPPPNCQCSLITTLVHVCDFPPTKPPDSGFRTCEIPGFDPSVGTLVGVNIHVSNWKGSNARYQIENLRGAICPGTSGNTGFSDTVTMSLEEPSNPGTPFAIDVTRFSGDQIDLDPFDGTIDYCGDGTNAGPCGNGPPAPGSFCKCHSGATFLPGLQQPSLPPDLCITNPAQVAQYVTTHDLRFKLVQVNVTTEQTNCANHISAYQIFTEATLEISYTYCPFPPQANPDLANTCQGVPVDIFVLKNDCSPAGHIDCGSLAITVPPTHGTFTINNCSGVSPLTGCPQTNNCPSCFVHYVPNPAFTGTDTFAYTVKDDNACVSSPATVTINVDAAPIANNDTATTCQSVPVDIFVLKNDCDADGHIDCSSLTITAPPAHGTLTISSCSGTSPLTGCPQTNNCPSCFVHYVPNPTFAGTDTFMYTVKDDHSCVSNPATVTVNVNAAPIANNDTATTCQGAPVDIFVLKNDCSPTGHIDCGSLTITTPPTHGTLTVSSCSGVSPLTGCPQSNNCPSCFVHYVPNPTFAGTDTFMYTVKDDSACVSNPATVTITVDAAPIANNDTAATCQGVPVDIFVLKNDCDPDGHIDCGSLTITSPPAHGTFTVSGCSGTSPLTGCPQTNDCPSCFVHYVPNPTFSGTDTFMYTVKDDHACVSNTATVTVTVNALPIANSDAATTCQGVPVDVFVLKNDCSPAGHIDCGSLTITAPPAHGTFTINNCSGVSPLTGCPQSNNCPSCFVHYVPNPTFAGTDTFMYTVKDDNACVSNPATVTITVDAAPIANNDAAATCPGVPVDIFVLKNDCDPDGHIDCGSLTITSPPAHGTFTLSGCSGTSPLTGCPQTNDCPGCFVHYVPNPAYSGRDTFTYTVKDDHACVSNTATVTITVNAAPIANNDAATTCQGVPVDIFVLKNDCSPAGHIDCGSLTITAPPAHGTFTVSSCAGTSPLTGCPQSNNCPSCFVHYVPNPTFAGTDTFTYTVKDDNACVSNPATVTVTVDAAPIANNDTAATCLGVPVDIFVLKNDCDPDGHIDCGSLTITAAPAHGTFTVSSCSGTSPLTGCPQVNNCPSCFVHYVPNPAFTGTDTFMYTVKDDHGCVSNTATVTVTINAAPIANADLATTCQGTPVDIFVLKNDCSPAGHIDCGSLTITAPPAHGTFTISSCTGISPLAGCPQTNNCPSCFVHYVPNPTFTGTDTFMYTVKDDNACVSNPATVTITVNPAPIASNDTTATCQCVPVDIFVLENDCSPIGHLDCGSLTMITPPAHGTFAINSCSGISPLAGCPQTNNCPGCFVHYVPTCTFSGTDTFTYTVKDDSGCASNLATVTITVDAAPIANNDTATTCQGAPVDIFVLKNDCDPDGHIDCGSFTITVPPAHGTFTINGCSGTSPLTGCPQTNNCAGCFVHYVPQSGFAGTDTFKYKVKDDHGCLSNEATVSVIVDLPPIANDDSAITCQGTAVDIFVLKNDCDPDGHIDCGSLAIVTPPVHGSYVIQKCQGISSLTGCPQSNNCSSCSVHYIPTTGPFFPTDTFTYTVTDDSGCVSNLATVNIAIKASPIVAGDKVIRDPNSPAPIIIHVLDNDLPGQGCTFDFNSLAVMNQTGSCGNAVPDHTNGTIVYTPTVTPCTNIDSFDYQICNTCGCCATAHVEINTVFCVERNRRKCGSLLLYPEFNNDRAAETLISITMACCEPSVTSTKVEFRFIDKNNCQEFNTTFTLTPCDTLTFLSSAVNPSMAQGYLYAYAKNSTPSPNNPTGTPIVFNHLIGQELIVDGIQMLEYGMNAVSFMGYGVNGSDVADGTPNDDNGDGIRDLNGPDSPLPEYDEAPDQILIPRFLGQDAPGRTQFSNSRIILINLSGGRAFTTTVGIDGYNDNEVPFSGQFTFYCWAKPSLRDFAPFTQETFLASSGSDPNGLLPVLNQETGWLRIDGLDASSSQATIHDPAIYAVLIEDVQGHFVADLPFERCSQTNGALLPIDLFGH